MPTLSSIDSSAFSESPSGFGGQGTPASLAKLAAIWGGRLEKSAAVGVRPAGGLGLVDWRGWVGSSDLAEGRAVGLETGVALACGGKRKAAARTSASAGAASWDTPDAPVPFDPGTEAAGGSDASDCGEAVVETAATAGGAGGKTGGEVALSSNGIIHFVGNSCH